MVKSFTLDFFRNKKQETRNKKEASPSACPSEALAKAGSAEAGNKINPAPNNQSPTESLF
jgi:phosphoribosylaminoimidazole-succinocarboxamide synthase